MATPRTPPPLNTQLPIVDLQGKPTPQFLQAWQDQMGINGVVVPLGTTAEVGAVLDKIGSTRGAVLFRGSGGWAALLPGTAGQVLTTKGPGDDPEWATSLADFLGLSDTPSSYVGEGGKTVAVKSDESGLEFVTGSGGGGGLPLGYARWTNPPSTGWSTHDIGTPTTNAFDSTTNTYLIELTGNTSDSFAYRSVAAGDFDIVIASRMIVASYNFAAAGAFVRDSGTNTLHRLIWANTGQFLWQRFISWVFNSTLSTYGDTLLTGMRPPSAHVFYWRFVRTSGTIEVYVSVNGLDWSQVIASLASAGSYDGIGITCGGFSTPAGTKTMVRAVGFDTGGPQAELTN